VGKMLDYYDTSFLDFYAHREPVSVLERDLRIEQLAIATGVFDDTWDFYDLMEMAATYTDNKGREYWNVNKVPLYMDEDDIYYLRQFPVRYWKQALAKRYNNLLIAKHLNTDHKNRAKKGGPKPMNDWLWMAMHSPKGRMLFFVDTRITSLYEKLTKPKDIDKLRRMNKDQRGEYEHGGGGFWHHTFDNPKFLNLQRAMDEMQHRKAHPADEAAKRAEEAEQKDTKTDSKRTNKVWLTEDFVGVGEATAEERLHHWLDGIRQGWLGHPQQNDEVEIRKLTWGGGGKKEQLVYSPLWLNEWVPTWQRKMKAALEAIRPPLPQFIIDKMPIDLEGNKVVWKALVPSDEKVVVAAKDYIPFLLPARSIDRQDVKKHDQYHSAHDQVEEAIKNKEGDNSKLVTLINKIRSAELPNYVEEEKQKLRDEFGKLAPEALEERLDSLALNEAILSVKYWLKEKGINMDTLSSDRVLENEPLRNSLIEKLSEFLEHAKQRMAHIKAHATRYDVWDWVLGDHNNAYDGNQKRHKRLYKTVTFGGIFPNRQQKVKTISDPDDWRNVLVYYFGQAREINGVPYVLKANIPNVETSSSLPNSAYEKGGAIWQGIHYALNSDVVMKHVPEWQTLSHHKRDLFQVINEWMMWQTGEAAFRDFMDAYNEDDVERMEQMGKLLFKRIRTKSQNFVISLFQLDILGRGTVRTRSGHKADAQLSVVEELGQFLKAQKQTLEDLAKDLQPQHQHRVQRPMSLGASGIPGHSIDAIKAQLKAVEIARKQTDLGPAFERLASGMAKDLLLATMVNIYISKMSDSGKKINRDYTYEDAETYARQVLGLDAEDAAQDDSGYESQKKEFFQKMETVITQWDMEKTQPKDVVHDLGPGGDMTVNLIYQLEQLNNNDREQQASRLLDTLENSLSNQTDLGQKAHAAGTDPEMARIAIEFVLYYFNRHEGVASAPQDPQAVRPSQGFTAQQESAMLQAYMRELFGGQDPPPAGPIQVPDSTIHMIIHGDGGRQIYDRLNDYSHPTTGEHPHIGFGPGQSINLTHHPRFLELAKAIVDAVNAKTHQTGVDIGGQSNIPSGMSGGF